MPVLPTLVAPVAVHLPPATASLKVVVVPVHIPAAPVKGASGFTVSVAITVQLPML